MSARDNSINLPSTPPGLAERVFENRHFQLGWVLFLAAFVIFIAWPIRNAVLVCWVYGTAAYFRDGIRVLPGKPIRFSNGVLAPELPDMVTGLGIFLITTIGLSVALFLALRLYERHLRKAGNPR
ncbi:MAG: hypothetical protein ACM3WP_17525 [Acidobacteriota bacterium]